MTRASLRDPAAVGAGRGAVAHPVDPGIGAARDELDLAARGLQPAGDLGDVHPARVGVGRGRCRPPSARGAASRAITRARGASASARSTACQAAGLSTNLAVPGSTRASSALAWSAWPRRASSAASSAICRPAATSARRSDGFGARRPSGLPGIQQHAVAVADARRLVDVVAGVRVRIARVVVDRPVEEAGRPLLPGRRGDREVADGVLVEQQRRVAGRLAARRVDPGLARRARASSRARRASARRRCIAQAPTLLPSDGSVGAVTSWRTPGASRRERVAPAAHLAELVARRLVDDVGVGHGIRHVARAGAPRRRRPRARFAAASRPRRRRGGCRAGRRLPRRRRPRCRRRRRSGRARACTRARRPGGARRRRRACSRRGTRCAERAAAAASRRRRASGSAADWPPTCTLPR